MSDTSDEYSAFDFSEFTEDDLKRIDADLAQAASGPNIVIEIESPSDVSAGKQRQNDTALSPLQKYRPSGVLSVTDLASLAWCEVQFDYGLRQRRSRPISTRPESFLSAHGKEIFVEKTVAAKNDEITKRGKAIHRELERELEFEQLQVDITSGEELWALRLVNILACLRCLLLEGIIREMPVFGIIHGEVVVGIIDEVLLQPYVMQDNHPNPSGVLALAYNLPTIKARSASHSEPLTTELRTNPYAINADYHQDDDVRTHTQPADPMVSTQDSGLHQYTLRIIDTKTRRTNSLPSHENTFTSRIQLMLYWRLLSNLISTSPPFDFSSLWKQLDLSPSVTFSTRFLVQAGLTSGGTSKATSCLDDLSRDWVDMVTKMNLHAVDTTLQLIYRLQPRASQWGSCKRKMQKSSTNLVVSQEALDLARAIEASLIDLPDALRSEGSREVSGQNTTGQTSCPVSIDSAPEAGGSSLHPGRGYGILDDPLFSEEGLDSTAKEDISIDDMTIIGTKEFVYDDTILNDYLVGALQWWHGHRKPRGVSLKESRRCFSCEYETDCEWREQKALEIRAQLQDRRQT